MYLPLQLMHNINKHSIVKDKALARRGFELKAI